jgi:hypothetical protein
MSVGTASKLNDRLAFKRIRFGSAAAGQLRNRPALPEVLDRDPLILSPLERRHADTPCAIRTDRDQASRAPEDRIAGWYAFTAGFGGTVEGAVFLLRAALDRLDVPHLRRRG